MYTMRSPKYTDEWEIYITLKDEDKQKNQFGEILSPNY